MDWPPREALVTGGASGIGRALVERLEREGTHVRAFDIRGGFDVGDAGSWETVEPVELACLNAGVVTGDGEIAELAESQYRRIVGANVDGVVLGVRRLARVMEDGGAIVVTASLAGLTTMELDPIYSGTKHFVVGFVRSVAAQLALKGITINAVCPAIVDTPILGPRGREHMLEMGIELLQPEDVAEAVVTVARSDQTGQAWPVIPGRPLEPHPFPRFFRSA